MIKIKPKTNTGISKDFALTVIPNFQINSEQINISIPAIVMHIPSKLSPFAHWILYSMNFIIYFLVIISKSEASFAKIMENFLLF